MNGKAGLQGWRKSVIPLVLPLFGLACYVLPALGSALAQDQRSVTGLVRLGVEEQGALTLFMLFALGLVVGAITRQPGALLCGLAAIALLPAVMVIDILQDPTSHNLWPIELFIYLLVSLVPSAGVAIGRTIRSSV
jgi:hypothetical protein